MVKLRKLLILSTMLHHQNPLELPHYLFKTTTAALGLKTSKRKTSLVHMDSSIQVYDAM
jgi:hypothetical protein